MLAFVRSLVRLTHWQNVAPITPTGRVAKTAIEGLTGVLNLRKPASGITIPVRFVALSEKAVLLCQSITSYLIENSMATIKLLISYQT